ncbi:MAG TPA: hypothetical protein VH740_23485 [Vicinamibacterales bacterium]|jgi:hypothetical protein
MAIQRLPIPALSAVLCFTALTSNAFAQQAQTARPEAAPSATTRTAQTTPQPRETPAAKTRVPQGFSVVLVLGDIQTAAPSDDVPPAARKALTDMRDFLPYKSFKLLDAAWLLCCGNDLRRSGETTTQLLRGPDGQEYELKLTTSRESGGEFVVRFTLFGPSENEAAVASTDGEATTARRLADARDRLTLLQVQLQEARKKFEVGTAPKAEVTKLEMEVRSEQRRIEDLSTRQGRGTGPRAVPSKRAVLDTTFTMDTGETVVVGTSRLRGGAKALIALLTAVPPRGASTTVRD